MKQNQGVTLTELLITITIIGIITALAIPSYQDYVRKQQREVVKAELMRLAQSQMKWRFSHSAFAPVDSLGAESITGYAITDGALANTAYFLIKATATGNQLKDSGCTELAITNSGLITPTGC